MQHVELLAPAGSVGALRAVIAAGADAVYIGGTRFGARAYAQNPDEAELVSAIEYAHLRKKKVYLTVNTLMKEREMKELRTYVLPYYLAGVDAVLVQDAGALRLLHREFPDLPLHASTQMTLTGPEAPSMLKETGVTRVVPARELSLDEIRAIKKTGLEVEVFIHGALCYCYSGQCLFSSMLGGRSGNRGRCAQPCRLIYRTAPGDRPMELLSPKDLCAVSELPELLAAGVDSLKIEGRMKQTEYAAGVTAVYRACLDRLSEKQPDTPFRVTEKEKQTLFTLYNRDGFTDGYFHRHNGADMMALGRKAPDDSEMKERTDLYKAVRRRYVDVPDQLPVSAYLIFETGRPAELRVTAQDGTTAQTAGEVVQRAERQPLSQERLAKQIRKTGDTDFEIANLKILTQEDGFLPMGALNALRREALAKLRDALLQPYLRDDPGSEKRAEQSAVSPAWTVRDSDTAVAGQFSVLVSDLRQLRAAAGCPEIREIAVEMTAGGHVPLTAFCAEIAKEAGGPGRRLLIALPRISRENRLAFLLKAVPDILESGIDGFLVRDPEGCAALIRRGYAGLITADASLYTWNHEALASFRSLGVCRFTAPVELGFQELSERDNTDSALIVYGRTPLMTSAQCVKKTQGHCDRQPSYVTLTDRLHAKFPVKTECEFCYNVIYNSVPLCLFKEAEKIRKLNVSSLRLDFTDETPKETVEIIHTAVTAFSEEPAQKKRGTEYTPVSAMPSFYTRGHFLRGTE